jgi:hypothetical protein
MYFFFHRKPLAALSLFCLILISAAAVSAQDKKWRTASSEEIQMKAPKIEADADAEALLWEVYMSDEDSSGSLQTVLNHYLRVKIFNERGREAFSKVDIPYGKINGVGLNVKVKDIAARTIKADGSTVELKEADIFERDIVKGDGIKLKAKSFAMPGIEPGAIIEYRWKEIRGSVSLYQRLQFAREIPVHLVKYYIKPLSHPEYAMGGQPFNATNTPFVKEKSGHYSTTMSNIPAFKDEPRMPPEYSIRPWLLVYYTKDSKAVPEKYWKDYGKNQYEEHKALMKVTDEVRQAAAEAVGGETDPDKKIEKIFNYVRAKIRNVYDDSLNLSAEALKNVKVNKTPADTLKRGQGNGHDINMLFAAMTAAAGFEARVANLPRRSDIFFPRWFTDGYFMQTENIAVKIGENWKFFDPLSRYVPYGMLRWEEEGQPVLISDSKEPIWATTQMSPAVKSMEKRTGKFKLLEDGTLEGEARIEFTGHIAAYHKEYNDDDTPQQREETLKNMVRYNLLSSAEISGVTIENTSDPDKPLTYTFKVRVPGYASRTGKRLFLQPGVFERSAKPQFETSNRRYDIYFQYPYAEKDDLTIELPTGFELENPDSPGVIKDNSGIGILDVKMAITNDKKFLVYKRDFSFGNGGNLVFETRSYQALKGLFDAFSKGNSHAVTLRQAAAQTSAK